MPSIGTRVVFSSGQDDRGRARASNVHPEQSAKTWREKDRQEERMTSGRRTFGGPTAPSQPPPPADPRKAKNHSDLPPTPPDPRTPRAPLPVGQAPPKNYEDNSRSVYTKTSELPWRHEET